jgi:DNA-binding FadR family transcriptional regulator
MSNPRGNRRGLHAEIVHELGLRIVRGRLPAGHVFPTEDGLSAELGVSRTVLREAAKVLAAKGLIESRPKTGTRVLPRSRWSLLDPDVLLWHEEAGPGSGQFFRALSEVRRIIEPAAAALAAGRASSQEIERIAACYRRMEETLGDSEPFISADLEFHAAIIGASHNELLEQMVTAIGAALRGSREITIRVLPAGEAAMMEFHHAVADAIASRDPVGAEAAMRDLLDSTARDLERVLEDAGGEPAA